MSKWTWGESLVQWNIENRVLMAKVVITLSICHLSLESVAFLVNLKRWSIILLKPLVEAPFSDTDSQSSVLTQRSTSTGARFSLLTQTALIIDILTALTAITFVLILGANSFYYIYWMPFELLGVSSFIIASYLFIYSKLKNRHTQTISRYWSLLSIQEVT